MTTSPQLRASNVTISYNGALDIVSDLDFDVPQGQITSIIGPNGCGKSTLLRAMSRLMKPRLGSVLLDGQAIHQHSTREVAKMLGMLSQQLELPEMVTVEDLVRRGRYPHRSMWQPPGHDDQVAVDRAMLLAGVTDLRSRSVDELSGGQRQRAWIAMVLAQDTPMLLLDEPTTYLDIAHSREVLELAKRLNREDEKTVVMVLHDLNDAVRYSDHIVVMKDGEIVERGGPQEIANAELIRNVFGVECDIVKDANGWFCIPRSKNASIRNTTGGESDAVASESLTVGYGRVPVLKSVSVTFPDGKLSAVVGPNACGKSTLVKTIARLLKSSEGSTSVHGRPIFEGSHRDFAQRVGLLSQGAAIPTDIRVQELVMSGRFPYQRWYRQWSNEDQGEVDKALQSTHTEEFRWRSVATLSGGQRQRAWLAMALAQQTPVLMLDEPTTFLDIGHQIELLDLVSEMNCRSGLTAVMVLHDLSLACRYADYMVAMKDGRVAAAGAPEQIVSESMVREVFGVDCSVVTDEQTGRPLILPLGTANSLQARPADDASSTGAARNGSVNRTLKEPVG